LFQVLNYANLNSGAECILSSDWKSPNKIEALCPPREGIGQIIIATKSGGIGTCNVQVMATLKTSFNGKNKTQRPEHQNMSSSNLTSLL
jgi:hypothetical protein